MYIICVGVYVGGTIILDVSKIERSALYQFCMISISLSKYKADRGFIEKNQFCGG